MADVVIEHLVKDYPDKPGAVARVIKALGLKSAEGEFMMFVRPWGPEICLYLITGAQNLVVRMTVGFAHFINQTLRLCRAVDRAPLFDPPTEEAFI